MKVIFLIMSFLPHNERHDIIIKQFANVEFPWQLHNWDLQDNFILMDSKQLITILAIEQVFQVVTLGEIPAQNAISLNLFRHEFANLRMLQTLQLLSLESLRTTHRSILLKRLAIINMLELEAGLENGHIVELYCARKFVRKTEKITSMFFLWKA